MAEQAEQVIWKGRPSHIINWHIYLICFVVSPALYIVLWWYFGGSAPKMYLYLTPFLLPVLYGIWRWIELKSFRFELSSERLRKTWGVFSRHYDELELYRVKDILIEQPFLLRLFGLGHVILYTSDKSTPTVRMRAMAKSLDLRNIIRERVEEMRVKKQVREVDFQT